MLAAPVGLEIPAAPVDRVVLVDLMNKLTVRHHRSSSWWQRQKGMRRVLKLLKLKIILYSTLMDPISKSLQSDVSCPIKSRFKNQNLERRRNSRVKKRRMLLITVSSSLKRYLRRMMNTSYPKELMRLNRLDKIDPTILALLKI